jgi:signal transduction histidine kinase
MRKDGTGLGLAIVHKIIQDHGGGIDVADNRPQGARVTFRLPGS